jgi:hypothetical protein
MLEQILVKSKAGQRCPKETRGMIYDHTPIPVPLTRFYQRMIAEGSLVRVETPVSSQPEELLPAPPVTASEKRTKKVEA